jgi:hypothetical protein
MKRRKSFLLSDEAIARGEQVAAQSGKSFSALIEERLLAIPATNGAHEEFWRGPALKPVQRPGDSRSDFLKRKHG